MASSRQPNCFLLTDTAGYLPPKTPGPLGINDRADPNVPSCGGDTPGSLGVNDFADPDPARLGANDQRRYTIMLLHSALVVKFLRSVAYLQVTAEAASSEKSNIGLWFTSTQVDTGDESRKAQLVEGRTSLLLRQFSEAAAHGSAAAIEFLQGQELSRDAAKSKLQEAFAAAARTNRATTRTLEHWLAGLKTTEYGAGIVLSVVSLFVTSAAALAAGIISFSYDTFTTFVDDLNKATVVNADILALASRDVAIESGKSLGKEVAKNKLAGKELEHIEELERQVRHLTQKIAIKQALIEKTSSRHNMARLTRSIRKNEAGIAGDLKQVRRFRGVSVLFVAWDVIENGEKIYDAWKSE